jgi:transposase
MIKQIRQKDPRTGVTYVYEAEVVWDKAKKQSRYASRRMLGHIDEATGDIVDNRERRPKVDAPSSSRLFAGATHLLTQIGHQVGLDTDLATALGGDAALAYQSFAQFLITADPAPASRFTLWSTTHAHPLGVSLDSQRLSELFASVTQDDLEVFFRARVKKASGQYWFFDTTSISSYSKLLERVRWGVNKDGTPLPQINLALVKDAQSGLPLAFKDLPGNISDGTLVKQLLSDFNRYGAGRMKLCMDRGFYSSANIDALMNQHMKFLIGAKIGLSYVKDAIGQHGHSLRSWEHIDQDRGIYGMRVDHRWEPAGGGAKRSYLHLYFDPKRANQQEQALAELLARLHRELESGDTCAEHQNLYEHYFHKVRGGWTGTDSAIETERGRHGYFALLSNDATLDCWQALDVYRAKDLIEKAFHDIKDRLDLRTTTVHNHQTLTGKLLAVFCGLIITTELRRRMNETGLNQQHTMTGLLDELETIEQYQSPRHQPTILHITKKQADIYTKLGIKPPATS